MSIVSYILLFKSKLSILGMSEIIVVIMTFVVFLTLLIFIALSSSSCLRYRSKDPPINWVVPYLQIYSLDLVVRVILLYEGKMQQIPKNQSDLLKHVLEKSLALREIDWWTRVNNSPDKTHKANQGERRNYALVRQVLIERTIGLLIIRSPPQHLLWKYSVCKEQKSTIITSQH